MMLPASPTPVTVTRLEDLTGAPRDAIENALADEAARWRPFGDVLDCGLDGRGRAVTTVRPRLRGSAIALRAAVAESRDHAEEARP